MMGEYGTIVSAAALFAGLVTGYIIGYRSGSVAGELNALKSMQHRSGRSRRRGESSEPE